MQIPNKQIRKVIANLLYPCPLQTTITKEHPKEKYYNNKYPKKDLIYYGRAIPTTKKTIAIDVRNFFNPYDSEIKKVVKKLRLGRDSDDEKALKCLKWVIDNIKYTGDKKKGYEDFWQFAFETLYYKNGDCEDGAILLANMILISQVPYWKIRLSAGEVKDGGHAYLTYYCESNQKWVVLDWCYWPNKDPITKRKDYKDEKNYLDVWLSWNEKYSFTKGLNTEAKHLLKNK